MFKKSLANTDSSSLLNQEAVSALSRQPLSTQVWLVISHSVTAFLQSLEQFENRPASTQYRDITVYLVSQKPLSLRLQLIYPVRMPESLTLTHSRVDLALERIQVSKDLVGQAAGGRR